MKKSIIFFTLLINLLSCPAYADSITIYTCEYDFFTDSKGKHTAENNFTFNFIIDTQKSEVLGIGNAGILTPMLLVSNSSGGITILEITAFGNVVVTAIDTELNTVHSRHSFDLNGELIPSQYFGQCKKGLK